MARGSLPLILWIAVGCGKAEPPRSAARASWPAAAIGVTLVEATDQADPVLAGQSLYTKVSAFGTKIGGHIFFIQRAKPPTCSRGGPMRFVAQFDGEERCGTGFWDGGLVYVFHCAQGKCGETRGLMQSF